MEAQQLASATIPCWRRYFAALGMLLVLAGCSTTASRNGTAQGTGEATWKVVVPPGTKRYQLTFGDVSSGAVLAQRASPVYPPELLATCPPPAQVLALVIVDKSGKVAEVRVAGENAADASRHRFISAVRTAVLRWKFVPLQVTHWAADADGNSHEVDSETQPFSLTYQFNFACHAGKAVVSTASAAGPRR